MDPPAFRDHHRLYCCYALTPTVLGGSSPATEYFELGRFTDHFRAAGTAVPTVLAMADWHVNDIHGLEILTSVKFLAIKTMIFTCQFSGAVLLLQLDFRAPIEDVVDMLAVTCFQRFKLRLANQPIVTAAVEKGFVTSDHKLQLGRDVHQLIVPSADLRESLFMTESVRERPEPNLANLLPLIYRENITHNPDIHSTRFPAELNRPLGRLGAHARGVTVMFGQAIHVEHASLLTVVALVGALARLRDIRLRTHSAMQIAQILGQRDLDLQDGLALVSQLAGEMARLEIDLSFGVEAHLDSLLIPEIVIDSYRQSLQVSVGIQDGLVATTRMLQRLTATVQAWTQDLTAEMRQIDEERRRRWSVAAGYLSVVAIPLSLLFLFFAIGTTEVNHSSSLFDLSRYWGIYATIALLVGTGVGVHLLMRIGARQQWRRSRTPRRSDECMISAHRGNSGLTGLTLAESYRTAIDLGVDFVEFDVRTTTDGVHVISHDEKTPSGHAINEVSYGDYKAELGDQRLTLRDLLQLVKGRIGLHCDLKEIGNECAIVELVLQASGADELIVTSLEDESVRAVKERWPHLQVGLSLGRDLEGRSWLAKLPIRLSELFPGHRIRRCGADFVAVHHQLAAVNVLRYCQRNQLRAWVWTVDDEVGILKSLRDPRVTTIVTNRPDVAVALRATKGGGSAPAEIGLRSEVG